MRLGNRLAKLEKCAAGRPRADQFTFITAVPVDRAEGREPGLYKDGPEGSTSGLMVFDPAKGKPVVPEGELAPWGLLIVYGATVVERPTEMPWELGPDVA